MKNVDGLSLILLASALTAGAATMEKEAVVDANVLNVRGQPTLSSEVVTQLEQGDRVVILEEIPASEASPNDPSTWAKIRMPANTPLWTFAEFIDPADQTVTVNLLNVRSGPGENFSVVGQLDRGTKVQEIRRAGNWMEIETPKGAYAYVAREFLRDVPAQENKALAAGAAAGGAGARAANPNPNSRAPQPELPPLENKPETLPPAAQPGQGTVRAVEPAPSLERPLPPVESEPLEDIPGPGRTAPDLPPSQPPVVAERTPLRVEREISARRIVRREGLVRSTMSIQAPTYFELISPETRKTINYLHTDSLEINLKDYRGRKVVVTGEEGIDARWPNTPVIEVETLEIAP